MLIQDLTQINAIDIADEFIKKMAHLDNPVSMLNENSEQIQVYKFKYISGNHLVGCYIVLPKIILKSEKLPCVILNRGGNGNFDKWEDYRMFTNVVSRFARWGHATILSQYSGNSDSEGYDQFGGSDIQDILQIKNFLPEFSFIDDKKISMIGYSRGGMMTYLSVAYADWINCAVSIAGVTNLERNYKNRPDLKYNHQFLFDVNDQKELEKRSVVKWADKLNRKTPILIIHGSEDKQVDVADAIEIAKELEKNNHTYKLKVYQGGDHHLNNYFYDYGDEIKNWLNKYL